MVVERKGTRRVSSDGANDGALGDVRVGGWGDADRVDWGAAVVDNIGASQHAPVEPTRDLSNVDDSALSRLVKNWITCTQRKFMLTFIA